MLVLRRALPRETGLENVGSFEVSLASRVSVAARHLKTLTERIRNTVNGSGAMVETGVLPFLGRYVSDGIVSNLV